MAILTAAACVLALGGARSAAAQGVANVNIPEGVAFSPGGGLLATANPQAYSVFGGSAFHNRPGTVSVFVAGAGGQLHEARGSPFFTGGINPVSLAFSPDGRLLAVANHGGDPLVPGGAPAGSGVSMFSVGAGGVLTRLAGSPFQSGRQPVSVAWSSTGLLAVADDGENTVSVFSVGGGGHLHEEASERLGQQPCGYPTQCAAPSMVRFSPDGGLLAIANGGDSTVSVFSVGPGGTLSQEPGSPVALPTVAESNSSYPGGVYNRPANPSSVSFGSGGLLAVLSPYQGRIYMFSVGAGGVTPEDVNTLPGGSAPRASAMSFNSSGALLATANPRSAGVSVFSVGSGGALTLVQSAATTSGWSESIALSDTGLLAVPNGYPDGSVSVFSVSPGGALTELAGSPFVLRLPRDYFIWTRTPGAPFIVDPGYPTKPVFNLNSDLLAIPTTNGNSVIVVSVASDGRFSAIPGVPGSMFHVGPEPCGGSGEPVCADPTAAAFSPDGKLLVTANNDNHTMSAFTVGPGGVLSGERTIPVGPEPPACSESGFSFPPPPGGNVNRCWDPYSVAFDPNGRYVAVASGVSTIVSETPFVTREDSAVSIFSVGSGGALTHVRDVTFDCPNPFVGSNNVAFNSTGTLLAASCWYGAGYGSGEAWVFKVGADGSLDKGPNSPFATGDGTMTVAFNPAGNLLALPSLYGDDVWVLSVDEATGTLTKEAVQATGAGPYGADFGMATGPLGELLATADYFGYTISLFSVGPGAQGTAAAAAASYGTPPPRPVVQRRADPLLSLVPGSPIFTGYDLHPDSITFSPNGHFLATGDAYEFDGFSIWAPTGPLEIRKTAEPRVVTKGGVLRYRITVHNPNRYPVTATVTDDLADVLDKGTLQNVTATVPTVTVDMATRLLTWHGNLLPGHTVTIRYSLRVNADANGLVTNRVDGPPNASCGPLAPEQPCETETPIVPPPGPGADLSLTKIPSTDTTHPGAQVLYTLVVRNGGPLDATGVTIDDPVPPGLFFHSAMPSQGSCTLTATDLTCRLGRIVNGGKVLVLVEATVADNARGEVTNEASVYGLQHDPNPDNNTARSRVTVTLWSGREADSDLAVAKRGPRTVTQGQVFRYTITVTNRGPGAAPDVVVIDGPKLPLSVVSINASQGRCQTGPPIKCALGTLPSGAGVTITITAIVTAPGDEVNAATVMSPSWDPDTSSNLAVSGTRVVPPPRFTG